MTPDGAWTVLLLDASPDVRWLVRRALEREGGFDVVGHVDDPDEAVGIAVEHRPDVVLVEGDPSTGLAVETVRRLRAATPATTILATLGLAELGVHDALSAAGASGVIRTTGSLHDLVRQLRSVLGAPPPCTTAPSTVLSGREAAAEPA